MFVLLFLSAAAVDVGLKQGKTVIVVKVIYFILFFFFFNWLSLQISIYLSNKSDNDNLVQSRNKSDSI